MCSSYENFNKDLPDHFWSLLNDSTEDVENVLKNAPKDILLQPKIKITDVVDGKEWGFKNIMSMNWDNNNKLNCITVDFMEDGNSNEFLPLYNNGGGEFISVHRNLKGEFTFDNKKNKK